MNKADKASVGIFWIDCERTEGVQIFADMIKLEDAETYGNHRVHQEGHYQLWGMIQKRNPKWIGVEYESIPRGRTVWKDGVFFVYANKIARKAVIRKAILEEFGLEGCKTKFIFTDEHYEIHEF